MDDTLIEEKQAKRETKEKIINAKSERTAVSVSRRVCIIKCNYRVLSGFEVKNIRKKEKKNDGNANLPGEDATFSSASFAGGDGAACRRGGVRAGGKRRLLRTVHSTRIGGARWL